ncbi:hypothetical protein Noda2021_08240 [Candidatus Dependentiae bacterium Noda2021]|nr:hypothetical protein Noda2021_08240 [Candidatus Dependentiae bacterium Noda2021]
MENKSVNFQKIASTNNDSTAHSHCHNHSHEHDHGHNLWGELAHHLPYAIFSVALSLVILSFVSFLSFGQFEQGALKKGSKMLFHGFHFMHITFAATGTLITFFRFSKNIFRALITGITSTVFFCTISDSVLPYLGGSALGVDMKFHLCFFKELPNVIPFLIVGLINGWVMSRHHSSRQSGYSLTSHFSHIFISSLASSFYLVSHGFFDWYKQIGFVFLFLIIAVVIPCTLADVVVPMTFARAGKKDEKH